MMTITSPLYSFVQLSPLGATSPLEILPFADTADIKFQFKLDVSTSTIADSIMAANFSLKIANATGNITDGTTLTANTIHDYSSSSQYFTKFRLSPTSILFFWSYGIPSYSSFLSIGQCFKMAVIITNGSDTVIAISNVFKRTDDTVFTTVVTYSCNEDSYGFNYCVTGSTVPNSIRVSFYLQKIPQFQDDESIYQKSNGSIQVLKSVTKKEYSCITDYLDTPTHEKLKIALSSDSISLVSDTYNGGVVKNGAYEITPLDITGDIDIAQAKFKLYATPYNVRNNNCGTC